MAEVIDPALATAGKICDMGNDPSKYLERFEDWYEHTSLLADSISIKDNKQKLRLILLWGGKHFRKFAKEAGVVTDGDTPDSLADAITKVRSKCGDHVNLSMAIFKLMHARQGTKSITEFAREVEDLATQCQFTEQPYTKERAMKDAIIFGTADDKLRQEALAKDYQYAQLMKVAMGYEQSRRASGTIKSTSGEAVMYTQQDVDSIVSRVLSGRYSVRSQPGAKPDAPKGGNKCKNCPPHYRTHESGKCPAQGKTCVVCKKKNHFAGSAACTGAPTSVKTVQEAQHTEVPYTYPQSGASGSAASIQMGRVNVIDIVKLQLTRDNLTHVKVNSHKLQLFVDSGCKRTLIPVEQYTPDMGLIHPTSIKLRPYGTTQHLAVRGEMPATLQCENGAQHQTVVYIVEGHQAEALLGDEDGKALGILNINPRGRTPGSTTMVAGITANLRAAGITVRTEKAPSDEIPAEERARIDAIVQRYPQGVRVDAEAATGLVKDESLRKEDSVQFHIDQTVPPVSAAYKPPPLAYHDRLSAHLQQLRDTDKIEDVGPNEYCPWVSNVVITEKKQKNQIRMNVDMREPNKALLRTKRHIETIQEIRHKLKGATRFSEMDMGHGYHQIPLDKDSRYISTFQTHEGIHRFKVLFFGASPACDLF